MSEARTHFNSLVGVLKSTEDKPALAAINWAENLLVEALRISVDEIEGAIDAGPMKPEEFNTYKTRFGKILDCIQAAGAASFEQERR